MRAEPSTRHFTVAGHVTDMQRRAFLATLSSLAVAGCTGDSDGPETVTDTTRTTARPTTTKPATTDPSTTTGGTPPQIRDLGVPLEQADCPFSDDGVERVVCYPEHTADLMSLTPSVDTIELPTDSVTFTLANDTDYDYSVNFYNWGLHKRVDDQWFYITPQEIPAPLHVLPAGESHDWTLDVDNTEEPTGSTAGEGGGTVAGLGGGTYAFEVAGWFESGDHEHRIGFGVHFDVEGDQIELTSRYGPAGSRDDDTVVVTLGDEDTTPTEAFVLERVGEAGVPPGKPIHDRIAEQLVRPSPGSAGTPFKDALAFFEDDVTTVRLEQDGEFDPPFDRDQRYYLRYRGNIYEAEVVSLD